MAWPPTTHPGSKAPQGVNQGHALPHRERDRGPGAEPGQSDKMWVARILVHDEHLDFEFHHRRRVSGLVSSSGGSTSAPASSPDEASSAVRGAVSVEAVHALPDHRLPSRCRQGARVHRTGGAGPRAAGGFGRCSDSRTPHHRPIPTLIGQDCLGCHSLGWLRPSNGRDVRERCEWSAPIPASRHRRSSRLGDAVGTVTVAFSVRTGLRFGRKLGSLDVSVSRSASRRRARRPPTALRQEPEATIDAQAHSGTRP